ncbi:MAG TPA: hypothetical protein VF666_21440 [Pyrinomonadaceae bacterium]|jgi:hypothetical protein
MQAVAQLSLTPLGAGDLIDRTIRLYRRHFLTFIRASVPPVVVSAAGSVLKTITINALAVTDSEGLLVVYTALALLGWLLILLGYLLLFIVMGGATHNLVRHLLWNEPVTTRTIYRNVRARFGGLLAAMLAVFFCLLFAAGVASFALLLYVVLFLIIVGLLDPETNSNAPSFVVWVLSATGLVGFVVASIAAQWVFFLLAGRVAYVPQVMLVEGKGVMASISRSTEMAHGNVRRLMAMSWFTIFGGLSMMMLLLVPLGWYAYLNGIDLEWLRNADKPVWYSIGSQLMLQTSTILLMPVWMLGLSLLYVDERVRREGYDIELMAARLLGDMPVLPAGRLSPLAPAIVATETTRGNERDKKSSRVSMLGLD